MGKKIAETLAIQLSVFCAGDVALETMSNEVIAEFYRIEGTERMVKDPASQRLYKVLHATRGLDNRAGVVPDEEGGFASRDEKSSSAGIHIKIG